jgi:hypothetical protein
MLVIYLKLHIYVTGMHFCSLGLLLFCTLPFHKIIAYQLTCNTIYFSLALYGAKRIICLLFI